MAERRRHRRGLGLVITLVVIVGLLVAADRVSLVFAQHAVSERLAGQTPFTTAPHVEAKGFPFLTQAARGKYDDVEVSGTGLTIGDFHGVGFDADLHGVHVPVSSVIHRHVDTIPIDDANGTVVIPFAEFARLTKIDNLSITQSNGQLTVTAPVRIPILNKTFDVVADGRVGLSGQDLQLTVDNIRVAGVSLPGLVVRTASDLLNSAVTLPTLPYGLKLAAVSAEPDGFHVTAHGSHVTISAS